MNFSLKLLSVPVLLGSFSALAKGPSHAPGEVLVKFKAGRSLTARALGVSVSAPIAGGASAWTKLKLDSDESVDEAIARLGQRSDVETVQPNILYKISALPNDPKIGQQWAARNTGQTLIALGGPNALSSSSNPGVAGADMGLAAAWDLVTDCSSVVVAVIDTGVNAQHEDLAANMWDDGSGHTGYDFVDGDDDPSDLNGHGTHVAGTLGAVGDNAKGTAGVCWKTKIMAVRVGDAFGSIYTSDLIAGVDYARTHGAKVMNLSLGTGSYDVAVRDSLLRAQTAGIVVAVAAGNDGLDNDSDEATYPCNYNLSNIVCVAALDAKDRLASFSNYGTTSVDIGAPGVNVASSWNGVQSALIGASALDGSLGNTETDWGLAATGGAMKFLNISVGWTLASQDGFPNTSSHYANNRSDRVWRNFDLSTSSGADAVLLRVVAAHELASGDHADIAVAGSNVDPFLGGHLVDQVTGSTVDGSSFYGEDLGYDISADCKGSANCNVGFRFVSDASGTARGIGFYDFGIDALHLNATSYNYLQGTSMATPHVAGLAALIFAYNPNFTGNDVVTALKRGGRSVSSLVGKSATGKAANAMGSLAFINAPTGVSATVQ